MSDVRRHTLTTAYLGAEQTIPAGSIRLEVWGVDANPATAHSAIWFRTTDQQGTTAELLIPAGQTFNMPMDKGGPSSWTYNVKSVAGTPDASVVLI
tara:strand:- start:3651 stop:3938 length:288 start_codon:yes stop_codon:yes gene_type:complete